MSSIAAPVVPIKLARIVPIAIIVVLTIGDALRSPEMRIPPAMVNRANRRTINGTKSLKNALQKIAHAIFHWNPPVGSYSPWKNDHSHSTGKSHIKA